MSEEWPKPLHAPFNDVLVNLEHDNTSIDVTYAGPADQLIASGAIEPAMIEFRGKGSGVRLDSHGFHYHRSVRMNSFTLKPLFSIKRVIMDLEFAESLPGIGIGGWDFTLLDWLDHHPGQVSVQRTQEKDWGNKTRYSLRVAGDVRTLVAKGYPAQYLQKKWPITRSWKYFDDVPKGEYSTVTKLMRGYFEFEHWSEKPVLGPWEREGADQAHRRNHPRSKQSPLRLAWVNPSAV